MKSFLYHLAGVLAIMLVSVAMASAQVESGQIAGIVTDQSSAVIAGATVTLKNVATGAERTTQTSATGAFLVSGLEPASYQVTISSGNFKPFSANAEVTVGGHTTVDAKLSVSAETTEVQVVGEGGVAVNTQSQELSQVVDTLQLSHLPSLTRNPYDFVALSGNISSGTTPLEECPLAVATAARMYRTRVSAWPSMGSAKPARKFCWTAPRM